MWSYKKKCKRVQSNSSSYQLKKHNKGSRKNSMASDPANQASPAGANMTRYAQKSSKPSAYGTNKDIE